MDEAIETLASPDVTVTNQSDKELQLYKLRELDSLVQEAVAQCESEAADPTVVEIAPAPDRGSNSIFERAEDRVESRCVSTLCVPLLVLHYACPCVCDAAAYRERDFLAMPNKSTNKSNLHSGSDCEHACAGRTPYVCMYVGR